MLCRLEVSLSNMRKALCSLLVFVILGGPVTATSSRRSAPPIGTALPGRGERIPGWSGWIIEDRGAWCKPFNTRCLFFSLRSGRTLVIALIRPHELDSLGGVETGIVTREFELKVRLGEFVANCEGVNGLPPLLGLLNQRQRQVRMYSTDGHALFTKTVRYRGNSPCDLGSD